MVSSNERPPVSDPGQSAKTPGSSPADAFQFAFEQLGEARDYVKFYLRARAELFRLKARNFLMLTLLMVTGGLLAAALIVTAVVLLCRGVAEGLGILFGRAWLGDLVTGFLLLALLIGTIYMAIMKVAGQWKQNTFRAYAAEKREEREVDKAYERSSK